ncbi:MAG TPA: hypothetical protein VN612_02800 [Acidobacteriaceae bacterium]|nr:hypothetical protein [Acidobacteriaceae bacterium]
MRYRTVSTQSRVFAVALAILAAAFAAVHARASVALLMEEPYGTFGAFNPTGHAAVYLNRVCAETPTQLRPCGPGEYGVVISRYHKIHGYDWIAVPLIPYLYAVDNASDVPASINKSQVAELRDAYRRAHLESLAPDDRHGRAPRGEWTQLVGSSYDRTIHGFAFPTTPEQDARFIAILNDRHNIAHFNLFFRNCADFSRTVIGIYLPDVVHRNFIADLGFTTPKQVARSLVKYDREHSEMEISAFTITQVPGSVPRSHSVNGVAESLIKSKKYLIPLAVLHPELTAGVIVAYLADGRLDMPKDPVVFDAEDFASGQQLATPVAAPVPSIAPAPEIENRTVLSLDSDGAAGGGAPSPSTSLMP